MKTLIIKLSFIVALTIFYGCNKEDILKGVIVQELDMGQCFPPFSNDHNNEYVISDDSTYQELLIYQIPVCDNYSLPEINFTKYSLLGKYTISCDNVKYYVREVIQKDADMKYIYNISINCKSSKLKRGTLSMNWVLVPKLATGYTVDFIVTEY